MPQQARSLGKVAARYAYALTAEDLLQEAFRRALEENGRNCPGHVDVVRFLAEVMRSIADGLALPDGGRSRLSIGFRPAVARCCKIGSRPNPDRAVEHHMARESFHEGEDGRRYGVMIINFRSCSAERCRPRPSEAAFLRLQSRRSLGELTKGEVGAAAVNIGRTVDPRSSPDAPPMELPRHAPS
jgi:hypothetical protein